MKGDDWRTPPPAAPGEDVHTTALVAAVGSLAGRVGDLITVITGERGARRLVLRLLAANIVILIVIATVGAIFVNRLTDLAQGRRQDSRILVECTTPGDPHAPNPDDHVHECYDRSQANQAAAVASIVDTNHNGIADTLEILANQQAIAKARGVPLPAPTTTSTTIPTG